MSHLQFKEFIPVGDNDYGYSFFVGVLDGRFVPLAIGEVKDEAGNVQTMLSTFPGSSEDYTLGLLDREKAIKLAGASALDPALGYGGIDRWYVDEPLRGDPRDFRCKLCDEVGCPGDCDDTGYEPDYRFL